MDTTRRDAALAILAAGSGAMDVVSFVALGGVFTSVMTGNLIVFGLAVGEGNGAALARTTTALAAFAVGVLVAAGVAKRRGRPREWYGHVRPALWIETVLLAAFAVGWEVADASPRGGTQIALLALAASAMGLRSGSIYQLGLSGVSTTYLTGTLTTVLAALAERGEQLRRLALLAAVVLGAITGGLLATRVPRAAPAPVLAAPLLALALAHVAGRRERARTSP
jgi:uncharacterized membrane protein YoaK (UPF0700 family)